MGGRSAGARTPYFLLDEEKLLRNLEILKEVSDRAGCKILLAQKAFSMFSVYPLIRKYLAGTAASGLYEARLGAEEFGGETHVFSPAYRRDEFEEILKYADHLVFNSPGQVKKFGERAKAAGKSIGLRLNPECSTQEGHAIYDPCAPGSRLGTTLEELEESELKPFQAAVDQGVPVVMVGHILLRQIDPEDPASLSDPVVTGLLRQELGFDGVVCTDDLTMAAISDSYGMGEAAVLAVEAGCDLLLVCHEADNLTAARDALLEAVNSGRISMDRLDESVYRLLSLKAEWGLTNLPVEEPDIEALNARLQAILP